MRVPPHKKIQIIQNRVLRIIADAPWFIRNSNLHKDFQIQEYIITLAKKLYSSLLSSTSLTYYNLHEQLPHDLLNYLSAQIKRPTSLCYRHLLLITLLLLIFFLT